MKLFISLTLISTLLGSAQGATAKQWQAATVTDISDERVYAGSSADAGDVNGGTSARYHRIWTYTIDAGSAMYVIRGACGSAFVESPCRLAVNGPVQIAMGNVSASFRDRAMNREGEQIYIKDDSGKEFKFSIAKKTLKP
jgi:hypothetical protein